MTELKSFVMQLTLEHFMKAAPLGSAPEDYSGLGKGVKGEASYLNNHWCTTQKLFGFELGAVP